MEALNVVVWVASVVTAVTVITGTAIKAIKQTQKLIEKNNAEHEFINYCHLWTLRIAIMNESFPIEERIEAGEQYIAHGGNGFVKHYLETLKEELANQAHIKAEGTI